MGTTEGAECRFWQGPQLSYEGKGNRGCGDIPVPAQQIQFQVAAAATAQQRAVSRELSGSTLGMHNTEKTKISGNTASFRPGRY